MISTLQRHACWMVLTLELAANGVRASEADTPKTTPAVQDTPAAGVLATWKVGTPIVSYWAGPPLTDAVAKQMADGGFNLVWCTTEEQMDVAHRYGLRAQFQNELIAPTSLDDPARRAKLDALIDQTRKHPAFYSYFVVDEPSAGAFADLGRLVAHLRQRDPAHLAYINLFPTYANSEQLGEQNQQLGTKGDAVTAYRDYVRRFLDVVKPALLSYDHYQFMVKGDMSHYFLNLAMIRQFARQAGLPFLNIVQVCSWHPTVRVPTPDEVRYLVYTTLAYGAEGISYFVYCWPGHTGGIILPDGAPTPLYEMLKSANREFVAIATEYQPLRSLGISHAGMTPPGAEPLADDAPFRLDPPVAPMAYEEWKPVKGILLGFFGPAPKDNEPGRPTHVLVVNLDYTAPATTTLVGPDSLEVFDAANRTWSPADGRRAALSLPPGGGKLMRIAVKTQ